MIKVKRMETGDGRGGDGGADSSSRGNGGGGRFKCVGQRGADLSVTVGDGIPGPLPPPSTTSPHLDTFPPPSMPPSPHHHHYDSCIASNQHLDHSYGCRSEGEIGMVVVVRGCGHLAHERGRPSAHTQYRKTPQDLWVISNMAAVPCSVSPPSESPPARLLSKPQQARGSPSLAPRFRRPRKSGRGKGRKAGRGRRMWQVSSMYRGAKDPGQGISTCRKVVIPAAPPAPAIATPDGAAEGRRSLLTLEPPPPPYASSRSSSSSSSGRARRPLSTLTAD